MTSTLKTKSISIHSDSQNNLCNEGSEAGQLNSQSSAVVSGTGSSGFTEIHNTPASILFKLSLETDSRIDQPATWNEYQRRLETFASRIERCPDMDWRSVVCNSCGNVVKKNIIRGSCLSPFCQDPECIKNRKQFTRAYLNSLGIYRNSLIHMIIGFPHEKSFTEAVRKKHQKVILAFSKNMQRLGTPLRLIRVRDIAGKKEDLFIHYHCAQLPVKDVRKFMQNIGISRKKVIENTALGFSVRFKHYRGKRSLFSYFSNRLAGVFGDIKNQETYGFADLMNAREYFDTFYNTRALTRIGMKGLVRSTYVPETLDNFPQECPFCHGKELSVMQNNMIMKPPDKLCLSCGLNVDSRDWNYQQGKCLYCTSPAHFIEYPSAKEHERSKFIVSRNQSLHDRGNENMPGSRKQESGQGLRPIMG